VINIGMAIYGYFHWRREMTPGLAKNSLSTAEAAP